VQAGEGREKKSFFSLPSLSACPILSPLTVSSRDK